MKNLDFLPLSSVTCGVPPLFQRGGKMKCFLAVAVVLVANTILGDEIVTNNGTKYENATVTRIEPDGVTVSYAAGIVKIPFNELSRDLQQKYHYDPAAAKAYAVEDAQKQLELYNQIQLDKATAQKRIEELARETEAVRGARKQAEAERPAEAARAEQRAASV
ncbi:MAG: hypothetical protein ABR514_07965, partial [Chthoniobacterales bacterium]